MAASFTKMAGVGILLAGTAGTLAGALSTPAGRAVADQTITRITQVGRAPRVRAPRPGDDWGGCDDARAAGTAPIYRDEPGYRANMDGDDDGIACEPVS